MENLLGQKFGMLRVSKLESRRGDRKIPYWECLCDCGKTKLAASAKLKSGTTTHCGCSDGNKTHGKSYTALHKRWRAMKGRCSNPKNAQYKNYGGRGISVCKEWAESFAAFDAWARSNGYDRSLELDRIDNNGNYSPENCRYVSRHENANNIRKNLVFTYQGKQYTLSELSKLTGVNYDGLRNRLTKMGMPVEDAVNLPFDRKATRKRLHGY